MDSAFTYLRASRAGLRVAVLDYTTNVTGRWSGEWAWYHYRQARLAALGF